MKKIDNLSNDRNRPDCPAKKLSCPVFLATAKNGHLSAKAIWCGTPASHDQTGANRGIDGISRILPREYAVIAKSRKNAKFGTWRGFTRAFSKMVAKILPAPLRRKAGIAPEQKSRHFRMAPAPRFLWLNL